MQFDSNKSALVNDLDGVLGEAVQQICASDVPDERMKRCLDQVVQARARPNARRAPAVSIRCGPASSTSVDRFGRRVRRDIRRHRNAVWSVSGQSG